MLAVAIHIRYAPELTSINGRAVGVTAKQFRQNADYLVDDFPR